jgi:Polyketide cyclase / dehydrase and lipid transport.
MHLESQIVIHREPSDVWKFLGSVENIATWDRGVVRTTTTKATPGGVGTAFSTFARADSDWGKMSYRIAESGPDYCKVQLTSRDGNARFVKDGCWIFRTEPHPEGTLVKCCVEFSLKLRYLFLAPLLWLSRSRMFTDLELLKRAVESESAVNSNQ